MNIFGLGGSDKNKKAEPPPGPPRLNHESIQGELKGGMAVGQEGLIKSLQEIKEDIAKLKDSMDRLQRSDARWAENWSQAEKVASLSRERDKLSMDCSAALASRDMAIKLRDESQRELSVLSGKYSDSANEIRELKRQIGELARSASEKESELKKAFSDLEKNIALLGKIKAELEAAHSHGQKLKEEVVLLEHSLLAHKKAAAERLENLTPQGFMATELGIELKNFDVRACNGEPYAVRVMGAVFQFNAALLPGAAADERLQALRTLGSSLYSAWSAEGRDAKFIYDGFVGWMNFLNSISKGTYNIIVPDMFQSPPPNVESPAGVAKVSKVELWIIKSGSGALFSKGKVS
jgi:hypothetical protein